MHSFFKSMIFIAVLTPSGEAMQRAAKGLTSLSQRRLALLQLVNTRRVVLVTDLPEHIWKNKNHKIVIDFEAVHDLVSALKVSPDKISTLLGALGKDCHDSDELFKLSPENLKIPRFHLFMSCAIKENQGEKMVFTGVKNPIDPIFIQEIRTYLRHIPSAIKYAAECEALNPN